MSSGYGDWNSATGRGYEGYGFGYGYGAEGAAPFGYGGPWEPGSAEPEPEEAPKGAPESRGQGYGGPDRYDPYDPYGDSERDPFGPPFERPDGDYGDPRDPPGDFRDYHDYPGDYHSNYHHGNYHHGDYHHANDDYRDYGDFGGDFGDFGGGADAAEPWGGPRGWGRPRRGSARPGARRIPSLFSSSTPPEGGPAFPRGFPGAFRGAKRMRRGWKGWDGDFRPQRKRLRRDSFGRKRKVPGEKTPKTDGSDNSSSENEEGTEGDSGEKEESRGEGEDEEGRDSEKGPPSVSEGSPRAPQERQRLPPGRRPQERHKRRHRDRLVERIQFVCSLCKFRTFFEDEIRQHLESKFHREHFQFVGTKLPPQTAQFLQEYVANKTRKTEERRRAIRDINGVIQQIQREQDLTQDVGLEHFLRKVEAAHCSACDLLIPMHFGSIQKHLKSLDHNHNRRAMLEQSKRSSLAVARSILNNKLISSRLDAFLRGENPFTDDAEEKEEHEEGEGAGQENLENPQENLENPQNPQKNLENPQNPEENPQNPQENPQNPQENPQNPQENSPNSQNPEENLENPEKNPEENSKNPQNPEENSQNPEENPKIPEKNPKIPEENSQNPEENPKIPEETPKIPKENPKIPDENLENPAENLKNPEENLENPVENLENPEKNLENPAENLENPEENREIPAGAAAASGSGTDPELENPQNSQNSPNSGGFPAREEEKSGM